MLAHMEDFTDVINSIHLLHMSKSDMDVSMSTASNNQHQQQQQLQAQLINHQNGYASDISNDSIFFYEDQGSSGPNTVDDNNNNQNDSVENEKNLLNNNNSDDINKDEMEYERTITNGNDWTDKLKQIKINVGIDEDLKMILEMDPSIVDDLDAGLDACAHIVEGPKITGLPPITGG